MNRHTTHGAVVVAEDAGLYGGKHTMIHPHRGSLVPQSTRRFVFAHAYAEVRYVLESNLMTRFLSSDGFKEAARRAGTVCGSPL